MSKRLALAITLAGAYLRNSPGLTPANYLDRLQRGDDSPEGEVAKGRLRPREYRAERGKGKLESARFNWEESRVALADGRELELRAATQDMLSVFFQLALMVPTDAPVISVPVVTGRKLEQYDFEVVGEASIDTPLGPRRTMHLRTHKSEGRDSTEVWLSLDDSRLPVSGLIS